MDKVSLVERLRGVGRIPPISLPSAFFPQAEDQYYLPFPQSLRTAAGYMASPGMEGWEYLQGKKSKSKWITGDFQGLTNDGVDWYLSHRYYIRRVDRTFHNSLSGAGIPVSRYNHIGDIDYHNGKIYAPLENSSGLPPMLAVFSAPGLQYDELSSGLLCYYEGGELVHCGHAPWCAINPLDGYLYTSSYDNVTELHVYDPSKRDGIAVALLDLFGVVDTSGTVIDLTWIMERLLALLGYDGAEAILTMFGVENLEFMITHRLAPLQFVGKLPLWQVSAKPYSGQPSDQRVIMKLHKLGGGCFSTNGKLYLSCDKGSALYPWDAVYCFSVLNGTCLGVTGIHSGGWETEGIAIWDRNAEGLGDIHIGYQRGSSWEGGFEADVKHWKRSGPL